jgi:hypothetical protein
MARGPSDGAALFSRFAYRPTAFPAPVPAGAPPERATTAHPARHGLQAAARAIGLPDPLDRRAVEAYWIGSLPPGEDTDNDNASAADARPWQQPTHALDVFAIGPWVRLLHNGDDGYPLVALDRCRVRWGRVLELTGSVALVSSRPLLLVDGHLGLGAEVVEVASRPADGDDAGEVVPGATVALHWDWICVVLDDARLAALRRDTQLKLRLANRLLQGREPDRATSA